MINYWKLGIILLSLLYCGSCSNNLAGGTGTDTGPKISGIILDESGAKISEAKVSVYPVEFNPVEEVLPDSLHTTSDREGEFKINASMGTFNVLVKHPTDVSVALIKGITIKNNKDTLVVFLEIRLNQPGKITFYSEEWTHQSQGFLYIPGTDIFTEYTSLIPEKGFISLRDIPSQIYPIVYYQKGIDSLPTNVLNSILEIDPGEVQIISRYGAWKNVSRVFINTSSNGAGVNETLIHYPLLLRLDSSASAIFNISNSQGSDLRFSQSNETSLLHYEIERWDSLNQIAEIWVKMDTLYGNSDKQFIYMFTGNEQAKSLTNGQLVFDTSNGFTGVYHLNEQLNGGPGNIKDRTMYGLNGTSNPGFSIDALKKGIIGPALEFDGLDDCIELPSSDLFLFDLNQAISISAWIKPLSIAGILDSIEHRVISIKDGSENFSVLALGLTSIGKVGHYIQSTDTVYEWSPYVNLSESNLLTLTFNGSDVSTFVNGVLINTYPGVQLNPGGKAKATIGCHLSGNRTFAGIIDEIRISKVERSEGWLKMNFENQKLGSTVIQLE